MTDTVRNNHIAQAPFWRQTVEALFAATGAAATGLSTAEARARLAQYGRNLVEERRRSGIAAKIARRLFEPLVAILLVAAAVSGLSGDLGSFLIIASVVILSILLDVVQEHRAEDAADALKKSVAIHADVRRDGEVRAVAVEMVVPGDIVLLRAGDLVPADGVVLESRGLHVNEALLTGEPYPVEKQAGIAASDDAAEASNALFAGTSMVSGEATMLVVATGRGTRLGGIARALGDAEPPSAFEHGMHRLGLMILRLTVFLVLFVLMVRLGFGRPVFESFLFAVALAVGLTPELMPMITTVTLSRGALRMARRKVIVKRLAAIHDLGAMDVLCTDKTGTLTEARIELVGHPGPDGADSDRVLMLAQLNSRFETGIRSPLDEAILAHSPPPAADDWRKIDEVPFDFERRCVSVLAEQDGRRLLVIKGAPEAMLDKAGAVETGDGQSRPLDAATRQRLAALAQDRSTQGFRLLGVAWKEMPAQCGDIRAEDESNLVFAGYCVFLDPPKASAAAAVARLAAAGVRVKVISGDHDAVVRHLVGELKIPAHGMLTGVEIARLTDAALAVQVQTTDLFARVAPDQKSRIIRALQARGHTVGFIGDGVNDAPAIHAAEVGISVDGATDVARSAADLILLAPDLGVVADGIAEGRRTFANILKYVRMGTSSNFGNMLSMALASLILPFLPLLPVQILLNNLLYDISEIGIPFDNVEAGDLAHPRMWDMASILRFTLVMGALSSLFDIATFALLLGLFKAGADMFRTAWFVESMATQILVIFLIRTAAGAWTSRPHWRLVVSSMGALAAALAIGLTPLGRAFGFVDLPPPILAAVVAIVAAYLGAIELVKRLANGLWRLKTG
ncbi:MAG: magnesium-translocating P-type ATPase [Xanthobacteraceae bacterium]|nr:MAG: magnesium-translocating P-type ATPase [Xanthobacteraceae bacterium]